MARWPFGWRGSRSPRSQAARPKKHTARRELRLEWLEPRLVLSGSNPLAGAALAAAAAPPVTLSPVADAYVQDGRGMTIYTNYGNAPDLLVKGSDNSDAESYLKFNLSGISGGITQATLVLTPLSVGSAAAGATFRVGLLSDPNDGWIEGSGGTNANWYGGPITWANSPYYSGAVDKVSGSQLTALQPISIDVTSLINQKFNQNQIASFYLDTTSMNALASCDFASRENGTAAYRPELIINGGGPAPVSPTITSVAATPSPVTGTTTALAVAASENGSAANLTYVWTETAGPAGASFSANNSTAAAGTTVTFAAAGSYTFSVKVSDSSGMSTTGNVSVTVNPTLTALALSPGNATLVAGGTQQFTVGGLDQFNHSMSLSGNSTWNANLAGSSTAFGNISTSGLFTAPATPGNGTIRVSNSGLNASTGVTVVQAVPLGLKDAALANFIQSQGLYPLPSSPQTARTDMIEILRYVETENGGVLSATDIGNKTTTGDLQTILTWNMPNSVQVLSGDIIDGSVANAQFQGKSLGNLTVGSSATQLEDLVQKWFYGADHPAAGYSYASFAGDPLYSSAGPSYTDEEQGALGDCYLITSLGTISKGSPSAIENMITSNGDGTYTVRFYANGKADYVTVDSMLPVSGGSPVYEGLGAGNSLWLPLLEKAYAQWNETGKEGRSPATNSYASIAGGWMSDVYGQALGITAQDFDMNSSGETALIAALGIPTDAESIGTDNNPGNGLYGDHAYGIIGYNSSNNTFLLYNPWGVDQPGWLTWSQLTASCDGGSIVNTANALNASNTVGGATAAAGQFWVVAENTGRAAADAALSLGGETLAASPTASSATGSPVAAAPASAALPAVGLSRLTLPHLDIFGHEGLFADETGSRQLSDQAPTADAVDALLAAELV